jgi:hypothetical protein
MCLFCKKMKLDTPFAFSPNVAIKKKRLQATLVVWWTGLDRECSLFNSGHESLSGLCLRICLGLDLFGHERDVRDGLLLASAPPWAPPLFRLRRGA